MLDRLLEVPGISGGPNYLLRVEFTTPAGAPAGSPYAGEIAKLTLIQNDGQLSMSSGKLNFPAQASSLTGDQGYYGKTVADTAFTRAAGLMLRKQVNYTAASFPALGWSRTAACAATNMDVEMFFASGNIQLGVSNTATPGVVGTYSLNTDYVLYLVLRGTGWYGFIKGGAYTVPTLLFVGTTTSTASLYPAFDNYGGAGTSDYVHVIQLTDVFAADLLATLDVASPVSGNNYTITADGLYHMTLTAPGVLANSGEMRYRVQDANNYWTAYFDSTGALKIDSVAAGTPTNRLSVAGVIAGSGTATICVITDGNKHNAYTFSGGAWTKRGSEINVNYLNLLTVAQPQLGAGWSAANLRCWARTSSLYNALDAA